MPSGIDLEGEWRALARDDLSFFPAWATGGTWRDPPHLRLLAERLMDVEAGRTRRLIVTMPPRHGKSELVSVHFPVWALGRHPDWPVIIASYGADLAYDFSRRARNEFAEVANELWGLRIAGDSAAVGRWNVAEHRGGLIAAGVGGPITGRGAQIAIIDDPVKQREDAMSAAKRKAAKDWYRSTLRTRLHPGGAIVLVLTRWHEDDLAGWLLAEAAKGEGEPWEIVNLPALAEAEDPVRGIPPDPLGREPGRALWPEQYDETALAATRLAVGSVEWDALYQQRPQPDIGGLLKRGYWRQYDAPPARFTEVIQSWDMAFKDLDTSDYVVGQVWGRIGAEKYLLDQVRDRLDIVASVAAVKSLSAKWPQARAKLVEDKANGPAVIAMLRKSVPGLIAVTPEGSKESRVAAVSPEIEAGNVLLPDPEQARWVEDFIAECAAFPRGAHDDQVDAMSQALLRFAQTPANTTVPLGLAQPGGSKWRG